jgi:hypothetical protein
LLLGTHTLQVRLPLGQYPVSFRFVLGELSVRLPYLCGVEGEKDLLAAKCKAGRIKHADINRYGLLRIPGDNRETIVRTRIDRLDFQLILGLALPPCHKVTAQPGRVENALAKIVSIIWGLRIEGDLGDENHGGSPDSDEQEQREGYL